MNISGVLVHAYPQNAEAVKTQLLAFPGVEVHAISAEGKLVVTVEEDNARMMADTVMRFQDVPGVLSAAMIYHHYEENEDVEQDAGLQAAAQPMSMTGSESEEASK